MTTNDTPQDAIDGWNESAFLGGTFSSRIAMANKFFGCRLYSFQLADIWYDKWKRCVHSGEIATATTIAEELLGLAPHSNAAQRAYKWLTDDARPHASACCSLTFIILSCKKYLHKAKLLHLSLRQYISPLYIAIGEPSISRAFFDEEFLVLPCPDDYESVPVKVLEMLKAVRLQIGPVPVMKIDDDCQLIGLPNMDQLQRMVANVSYAGQAVGSVAFDRCWHAGKCTHLAEIPYGKRFKRQWARGSLYYLGSAAVDTVVREYLFYPGEMSGEIYEDKLISDILFRHEIDLVNANLWEPLGLFCEDEWPPPELIGVNKIVERTE